MYGMPYYEQVQNFRAEIQSYEEALETADQVAQVEADLEERYESFTDEELEGLSNMLPEESQLIEDVAEISRLAQDNGVDISDVEVKNPQESQSSGTQSTNNTETLPISYSIIANYENFRGFLQALENRLRVTDVTSISFSVEGSAEGEGPGFYNIELGTQAYWLNQ